MCDAKGSLCKYACVCVFNYISLGSSSVVLPYSSTMIGVSFFSHRGFLWQLRKKRKPWGGLKYDVSTRYASLSVSLRLMSSTMSYYLCNRKAMPASFFFFDLLTFANEYFWQPQESEARHTACCDRRGSTFTAFCTEPSVRAVWLSSVPVYVFIAQDKAMSLMRDTLQT